MSWYRNMRFIIKVRYISIDQALFYICMHMCVCAYKFKNNNRTSYSLSNPKSEKNNRYVSSLSMGMQSEDLPVA